MLQRENFRFLLLLIGFSLGIWGLSSCEKKEAKARNQAQVIADSLARADSMAMVEDSLERLRMLQEVEGQP